jgi:hypothetical protein
VENKTYRIDNLLILLQKEFDATIVETSKNLVLDIYGYIALEDITNGVSSLKMCENVVIWCKKHNMVCVSKVKGYKIVKDIPCYVITHYLSLENFLSINENLKEYFHFMYTTNSGSVIINIIVQKPISRIKTLAEDLINKV